MHCITKQTHNWILQCAKSRDPGLVLPLTISVYDLLSHSGSGNNDKAYAAITWHNDPASLGLESRLADHSSQAATNSATGAGSPGEFIMLHFWAFLQHHLWQMRDHWCVTVPCMSDLVYGRQATTVALFISGVDGRDDQQLSIGTLSNRCRWCVDAAVNFNSLQ